MVACSTLLEVQVAETLHPQSAEAQLQSLVRELDPTTAKSSHMATKTQCSQIKFFFNGSFHYCSHQTCDSLGSAR